ncbi:O-antigen ligase family protein [Flavobacterium columnare]|uniref:O-antigen ligase family protein n=1 Tax=Flavobacterium columnare TaxID=996 RepID=A0AAI8CJX0_9FLAO|nr:O-antigen ligase family protein [Flavobacterium columnare]AMO21194.1 O-antigen ligase family protein [Flavobacterium columnare]MEB3802236.1 O-antigen ligase family protein [Flavobacterium columnare]QOG58294.1 O-antigen ligase family protein [Flavobacterium columnare]QOG61017.1 O-antigen ligase family protein [Flavobacterium columnare]QOG63737.1 O-antigen ligase family protein [Flavobacterium columnare]
MEQHFTNNYLKYYALHLVLGALIFMVPFVAEIYSIFIFISGIFIIYTKKNKRNEALLFSGYVVGIEVLLRMTNSMHINEYGKYVIIAFLVLGMYYRGVSKTAYWYLIYLLLLVPSLIIGSLRLNFDTEIRKAISFNISGPICLAIAALYCYNNKIKYELLLKLLLYVSYPLLSMMVYLILFNPSVRDVVTDTSSNFATSGGFGPNQVSTILGLGMFLFFVQFLLNSKSKIQIFINFFLVFLFSYRCLLTFSRGGMYCGVIMILIFILYVFSRAQNKAKQKIIMLSLFLISTAGMVWFYSSFETGGLIEKRYANKDAIGRVKESRFSGREDIAKTEINMFFENPVFGVGVGKNKEFRQELTGMNVPTHSEFTRSLAEHGMVGVIGLLVLIFVPLFFFLNNKQHFFFLPFFLFWFITVNHAAMRLAAPAFIYALSLLKVEFYDFEGKDTNSLHR